MFERLFAESGLSLDRVRALLEVGAAGSIVRAAHGEPVRQSQFSRQIKELEDFFQTKLVERHGKGICLTAKGKELARISRFFLLGLSNFQRGCLTEEETFRIGAGATFIESFLLPLVTLARGSTQAVRYQLETTLDNEIERRLHDLTLDFGVVTISSLSRPLQMAEIRAWRLQLWVPRVLQKTEKQAVQAFKERRLRLIVAERELERTHVPVLKGYEPALVCDSFLQARTALTGGVLATVLPDFLRVENSAAFLKPIHVETEPAAFRYRLAWNPRLMRLNPHAGRRMEELVRGLGKNYR